MSTIELPPDAASPGAARRFVTECLDRVSGAPVDVAVLLTSELVTNAVLHAGTPMVVTVTSGAGLVRVAVRDGSAALPVVRYYDRGASTGRGLQLVETLARRWGVETDGASKTVWFEVASPDEPGARVSATPAGRTRRRSTEPRGSRPPRSPRRRSRGRPELSRSRPVGA
jgi:anti-sigma regulatory factor (Ser/Thr protein kinase)